MKKFWCPYKNWPFKVKMLCIKMSSGTKYHRDLSARASCSLKFEKFIVPFVPVTHISIPYFLWNIILNFFIFEGLLLITLSYFAITKIRTKIKIWQHTSYDHKILIIKVSLHQVILISINIRVIKISIAKFMEILT